MRPIDADALEKYVTEIMPGKIFSAYGKGVVDILTHLLNFVRKEMPTVEAEPRWIPCSERLPELNEMHQSECVLVCALSDNWIGMAYYIGTGWAFADAQTKPRLDMVEVTHWMPLPEPPMFLED